MDNLVFVIAPVSFWEEHGFDTTHWRKSVDKTKAVVHIEVVSILSPTMESFPEVAVYTSSEELSAILNGPEWTVML